MLKIIVSSPRPFAGVSFIKYEHLIKKAQDGGHKVATIQYFHGKLESHVGYDIGACLNAEKCIDNNQYIEGIYDAEVIGYPSPCKAFLWNAGIPRGLIVDASDKESMKYAEEAFKRKEENL